MWRDLSLRHLLAFRAVAEEGTFGRAAERLGFTQSAVSQQIASLESMVGHELFDRPAGPRPPRLTEAGQLLVDHVERLLQVAQAAEHDLDRYARGVSGKLAIGTFQSISARVLPFTLRQLRQEAPDVELTLIEEDQAEEQEVRAEALASGDLDLAFMVGVNHEPFASQYLGEDPHVAVVPNGYPEGPVDLQTVAGQSLVGQPPDDTCGVHVDQGLERLGITPRYAFRSYDNGAVQGMVGAGVGIAIVPLLTVDTSDPAVSVRATEPALEPRRLSIVWSRDRELSPIARRFVDIATDVCAERLTSAWSEHVRPTA